MKILIIIFSLLWTQSPRALEAKRSMSTNSKKQIKSPIIEDEFEEDDGSPYSDLMSDEEDTDMDELEDEEEDPLPVNKTPQRLVSNFSGSPRKNVSASKNQVSTLKFTSNSFTSAPKQAENVSATIQRIAANWQRVIENRPDSLKRFQTVPPKYSFFHTDRKKLLELGHYPLTLSQIILCEETLLTIDLLEILALNKEIELMAQYFKKGFEGYLNKKPIKLKSIQDAIHKTSNLKRRNLRGNYNDDEYGDYEDDQSDDENEESEEGEEEEDTLYPLNFGLEWINLKQDQCNVAAKNWMLWFHHHPNWVTHYHPIVIEAHKELQKMQFKYQLLKRQAECYKFPMNPQCRNL